VELRGFEPLTSYNGSVENMGYRKNQGNERRRKWEIIGVAEERSENP
jgi:hypothetical protein